MDVLAKLNELKAFANLIIENVDAVENEIVKQGKSKQAINKNSMDFVARTKAKRAKVRIS